MKQPAAQWRVRISEHNAFLGYRWLAWGVAALTLTFPGYPSGALPWFAGLVLLTGALNVAATALVQRYARLLRRRPLLFALDLAVSMAVLWLSGGRVLPFLPYALSSLALPGLLLSQRGALIGAAAFMMPDLAGVVVLSHFTGAALEPLSFALRALAPFLFTAVWIALGRRLDRGAEDGTSDRYLAAESGPGKGLSSRNAAEDAGSPLRLEDLKRKAPLGEGRANIPSVASSVAARATAEHHPASTRRVIYDLSPTPDIALNVALERLGAAVAQQSGLDVRVTCTGTVRRLHAAQYAILLRTAQEALQNVQQHARANTALVSLRFDEHTVTLMVQDDGVGLLDGTYERPGLHALRAVRYRLAEFDGHLNVFEGETGGVTVQAVLPLDRSS